MGSRVTNYKCPACTGPLHFVGKSGKLECDYCGSKFDIAEIEALYAEKEAKAEAEHAEAEKEQEKAEVKDEGAWDVESAGGEWGAEGKTIRAYSCPSCGAEIICDETAGAVSCPYCGNPSIIPGQFTGNKRPDYVIPFKLEKKDAVAALKNHYKGKFLLPKAFTNQNHIEEIKGIYVPFWLFDGDTDASMRFHGTHTHVYRDGDYDVTETKHYDIIREGNVSFEKIPVDGSSKMPDDFMDSIEPFDYSELKEFSTAYLPGFMADKYDVDAAAAAGRADERCHNTARRSLEDTVIGYETVNVEKENININRGKVKYALMPVWLLNTKWHDKNYLFAMNGQTGKLVGDLPADKSKLNRIFWGLGIGLSAVFSFIFSGAFGSLLG